MTEPDPETSLHAARRALRRAQEFAAVAAAAARHAGELAAGEESKAARRPSASHLHNNLAGAARRNQRRQHAAAQMHQAYARRLQDWIARRTTLGPPPVFMSGIADTTAGRGAVLSVRGDNTVEYLAAASDTEARRVHEIEMSLGEGPTTDAMHGQAPAVRGDALPRRWPTYGPSVRARGVTAIAAAPLHLDGFGPGGLHGALTILDPPHRVTDTQNVQTVAAALDDTLTGRPDAPGLGWFAKEDFQPALHAASGMLVAHTRLELDDAVALIRAHAHAEDRLVADVATDIIDGTLTLP